MLVKMAIFHTAPVFRLLGELLNSGRIMWSQETRNIPLLYSAKYILISWTV